MAGSFLHEGERLDELQRNGYKIIQDPKRFCFGMDAVLLSGFAKVKRGEEVLDLGGLQSLGGPRFHCHRRYQRCNKYFWGIFF